MNRKTTLLMLALALVLALAAIRAPEARAEADDFQPFFRMDMDGGKAWEGKVYNLRLLTRGKYKFGKILERYGVDAGFVPDTTGLDALNISGSAQFSMDQLRDLAATLRKRADGKAIYIVDLRGESHVFLNGNPISWYCEHNWGNYGKTLEEVRQDEAMRFAPLVDSTIRAYGVVHDQRTGGKKIKVKSWTTEAELVAVEGFGYLRLPCPDHAFPPAGQIDAFIEFVKGIDMDNTWLHFHCHAGVGRTGIFMMLYDKMKNPGVAMQDILVRQALTGSEYPVTHGRSYHRSTSFHGQLQAEKNRMTPLLFQYVEENWESGYAVPWSQWLAAGEH